MTQPTPASPETTGGISRRALVTTAAWSAPVIGLAIAAPTASASVPPVPFTVDLDARAGDALAWYNAADPAARTFYNEYTVPIVAYLSNTGATATPEGLVYTLTWDDRVLQEYTITGAQLVDLQGSTPPAPLPSGSITVIPSSLSGTTWTTVVIVNVPIPAGLALGLIGTRSVNETIQTDYIVWPDLVPLRYEVTPPSGYTNSGDGVIENTPTYLPYERWDVTTTAPYFQAEIDGCSFPLPDYYEITALGPNPIPAGRWISTTVDPVAVTAIGDPVVTIDGSPAPGFLVDEDSSSGPSYRNRSWSSSAVVPVGSTLRITIPYTLAATRVSEQVVEGASISLAQDVNFGSGETYFYQAGVTCPV